MSTFNLTGYTYSHSINIVATVVEEGTGKLDTPAFIKKRDRRRAVLGTDPSRGLKTYPH